MSPEDITAIILAAGYSSRMGHFKPLLQFGDEVALERSVRLFQQVGVEDVRVVTGYRGDDLAPYLRQWNATQVVNERFEEGMFSSVQAGVRTIEPSKKAFFLLPADIPLVRGKSVRELMDVLGRSSAKVVYPCFQGRRGHPPLISIDLSKPILDWSGEGGLRPVLNGVEERSVDVEVADEYVLRNMNTWEDYVRLRDGLTHYDIPSPAECLVLLVEKCSVGKRLLAHSFKVADVALNLVRELNKKGCQLNEKLVVAAALLHDSAKGCPDHAGVAAHVLKDFGFPAVAELVAAHMDSEVRDDEPIDELDILRLSDRLVEEDRLVTLDYRFQKKMAMYGTNALIAKELERRFAVLRRLEHKVNRALGKDMRPALEGRPEGELYREHCLG